MMSCEIIENLDGNGQISGMPEKITPENEADPIPDYLKPLENKLVEFSRMISGFCPEEIPDLGIMLNSLDRLIDFSKNIVPPPFFEICIACKGYIEKMILENINDTRPIEEGLLLLRF